MNKFQLNYFLQEVEKNKGSLSEVTKDEVITFCESHGIEYGKRIAKSTLIDYIQTHNLAETFYNQFCDRFLVPIWEVAKCYNLYQNEIETLMTLGIFAEQSQLVEYKNKNGKFEALAFPLTCLDKYTGKELKEKYNLAYHTGSFRMRIETENKEDIQPIIEKLSHVLVFKGNCNSYKHRNGQGYYHYLSARVLPNDPVVEVAREKEIETLKAEILALEEKNRQLDKKLRHLHSDLLQSTDKTVKEFLIEKGYLL